MNAICERGIGTIRRECLDWLIALSESHLRFILKSWIGHYNGGGRTMLLQGRRAQLPVVVDENVITSRFIYDIPQFVDAIVAQLN